MWAPFTDVLANCQDKHSQASVLFSVSDKRNCDNSFQYQALNFYDVDSFFFESGIGIMSLKRLWLWACPQNQVFRSVTLSSFLKSSQLYHVDILYHTAKFSDATANASLLTFNSDINSHKARLDRTGWYTENERNYCSNPRSGGDQTSPPEKPMHLASKNIRGTRWQCTYVANMVPWKYIS